MKITYDEQGRVTEVVGSGENGELKESEVEIFKSFIENERKKSEKLMDSNKEVGKDIVSNIDKIIECTFKSLFDEMNGYCYRSRLIQPDPNNKNKTVEVPENPSSN